MATPREKLKQYAIGKLKGLEQSDKDRITEGTGSYGKVYRVTVNGVPRIAKQLHSELVSSDIDQKQKEAVLHNFYRECLLLSELYHQNVVEFIGVHFGWEESEISLIMELMYIDLDKFISDKQKYPLIPISIKASILLDVSYGLVYLHSLKPDPVVHRDLTAKNILLTKDFRAKIADLGVAKMLNLTPNSPITQTKCPGTQDYMPPEALSAKPCYGTELDIFSIGHLMLCLAVQDTVSVYECQDGEMIADYARRNQFQVLKRKEWIDSLKFPDSLFRELIIRCLCDMAKDRPTAKEVSSVVKIICDKFPKTPSDFASVWNKHETAVFEKGAGSDDVKTTETRQLEELTSAKEEIETLKSNLFKAKEEIKALNSAIEGFREQRTNYDKVIDNLQQERDAHILQAKIFEKDFETERNDRAKAYGKIDDLEAELAALKEKIEADQEKGQEGTQDHHSPSKPTSASDSRDRKSITQQMRLSIGRKKAQDKKLATKKKTDKDGIRLMETVLMQDTGEQVEPNSGDVQEVSTSEIND